MGASDSKEQQTTEEHKKETTKVKESDSVAARPKIVHSTDSRRPTTENVEQRARRRERIKARTLSDQISGTSGRKTIVKYEKADKLMVMAIDFGTTFSGYAYSFLSNKKDILTNYWQKTQIKTPTIVLMDKQKKFHSFGQEAKENYIALIKKREHQQWYYFENFKMKLFVQEGPLDKSMKLAEIFHKEVPAIDVFAAAIEYMKDHFLDKLHNGNDKEKVVTVKDVHFILTVPAIWSDLSKQFMRQAAIMAGIPDGALSLALEPEAASLYCKGNLKDSKVTLGTRYIVADLGGGTADFTCHEVNMDQTLKELQKPSGGDYGGTTVDNAFRKILNKIFGANVLDLFKRQNMEEYCDLFDRFQLKKKTFDGNEKIILVFPLALLELFEDETEETVDETLKTSPYKGRVEFKLGKMFITVDLAKDIFNEAVQKIVDKTSDLLKAVSDIEALVLVGGFSESPYLQEVMKKKFDMKTMFDSQKMLHVYSPVEPASAVIKGAVIYGHQPRAIDSRVCKYSYGIARMMRFKDHHEEKRCVTIKGVTWCNDLFNKHIEVGQNVRLDDDFKAEEYFPVIGEMKQAVLEVYVSPKHNPTYVDDEGCQLVGLIPVDLTGGDVHAKVLVKLIFGGTELRIEVVEEKTGKTTIGHVDFLG